MIVFDRTRVERELAGLSTERRIAFCASCCQRMVPNYEKFSRMENWGRPDTLRTSLAEVWSFLSGASLSRDRIERLAKDSEKAAPDTDQFTSLYTSSALDAASAVVETLRCCADGDPSHGVLVATAARDSVDMYVQMRDQLDPTAEAVEERIKRDPLMQRELQKQRTDLASLRSAAVLDRDSLRTLRKSSSYDMLA